MTAPYAEDSTSLQSQGKSEDAAVKGSCSVAKNRRNRGEDGETRIMNVNEIPKEEEHDVPEEEEEEDEEEEEEEKEEKEEKKDSKKKEVEEQEKIKEEVDQDPCELQNLSLTVVKAGEFEKEAAKAQKLEDTRRETTGSSEECKKNGREICSVAAEEDEENSVGSSSHEETYRSQQLDAPVSSPMNLENLCRSMEDATVIGEQTHVSPLPSSKRFVITCNTFGADLQEHANIENKISAVDCLPRGKNRVKSLYDCQDDLDFHEAVRRGDAECVAALLAKGYVQNLDEPDWNVSGDPPLLVAATNLCLPVLSTLLAHGCDPAVRSPRGETALHRVILNGGPGNVLNFVGELLKYGCPPGVKEAGGGLTALHILTRQLSHVQNFRNFHHDFEAALKTLELLAKAGPVNAKDHQGRTPLHILVCSTIFDGNHRGEIESLIETLLSAGANPASKNDRGETALHECLECGALNTASLLIPHTPTGIMSRYGETPLHIASRKNYVKVVGKLLERGEDPSAQDAGGNTPLHLASARGFHQTVSLLITSPLAQLEKTNADGLTALQIAAESGFVNAVRLLLKAGADPSQTIHYCATTLQRHPDISLLIDHELMRRRQLAA